MRRSASLRAGPSAEWFSLPDHGDTGVFGRRDFRRLGQDIGRSRAVGHSMSLLQLSVRLPSQTSDLAAQLIIAQAEREAERFRD